MRRLWPLLLILLLGLAACASQPQVVYRTVIETCPAIQPPVQCRPFPPKGKTLRAFRKAWEDAKAMHAECTASLDAWETSWKKCGKNEKAQ